MNRQAFNIVVMSPMGTADPSLVIAAARAGHIGILDAERQVAPDALDAALEQICDYANAPFGLKLILPDADDLARIGACAARGLEWVVLDGAAALDDAGSIAAVTGLGPQVLLEVIEWDPRLSEIAGVAGLIVKGHESGGRVGEKTAFILLQKAVAAQSLPVYVRGGLGLHSGAAARAGGAAGIVLDDQVLMVRESGIKALVCDYLARFTGIETGLIEAGSSGRFRLFERPGSRGIRTLQSEISAAGTDTGAGDALAQITARIGWNIAEGQLAPIGQAATFAPKLADDYGTLGRVARAYLDQSARNIKLAARLGVLAPGTGVAQAHGTRFPIVQGPMTRVSDTAKFAQSVADAGALPMVALALMRPDKVETLLAETEERLAGKAWGVGLLGFAPSSLIKAQVEVARRHGPGFALIAGGRPDQARELEQEGIPSYLHVPSPRLLTMFLEQGAKRFVFEGRECGGHVGPLSSFVLWDHMVSTLLEHVSDDKHAQSVHVLFAGGIHDAASSAMVAAMAAPLAERGIKVGVLAGTAYLFTKEAVSNGGIVPAFQKVAIACEKTIALETGPGHASRAAISPFATEFQNRRHQLEAEKRSVDDIRDALEDLTLGRLRVASKAIERNGDALKKVPLARQKKTGMYMIGQVATLRDKVTTMADLHAELSIAPQDLLSAAAAKIAAKPAHAAVRPADIAIVGIGATLPNARNVQDYWENILDQVVAIREIPRERWDYRLYFDEDRDAEDKIYSKWGGFLDDMEFDPFKFGIPPRAIKAIDPLQLMALEIAGRCLADAGYAGGIGMERARASVILGASGGAGDVGAQYAVRSEMTRFTGGIDPLAAELLPKWTEDSFAGILLNVTAGRTANRFDFGGVNYTIDAACGSSLAALYQAVLELETRRSDFVIAGGVDTVQGPFGYLCFSKSQALSPRGASLPLQADADGIVISEGIAMVALKRLADAERDGDKIYAVIKGVGASSDGRAKSMTAPHPDGQIRALERAYEMAGYSPATVGHFEAHGTGTVVGDTAEMETVTRLLSAADAGVHNSAIGSVKAMIGHTKASAGVAGLIKSALALYHGVLPPHGRRSEPNQQLLGADTPLYLVDEPTPWMREGTTPRRAGISAFGFGGTNFHLALEEYDGARAIPALQTAPRSRWSHELLVWRAADKAALASQLRDLAAALKEADTVVLRDLAYTLARDCSTSGISAALVVSSSDDPGTRIAALAAHIEDGTNPLPPGAHYSSAPLLADGGKLALIFPGQGTQYPQMLRELFALFPEAQDVLARADTVLSDAMSAKGAPKGLLSRVVLPVATYDDDALKAAAAATLTRTDFAQPALGAIEAGLLALLDGLGVRADMATGHSYGEFVALHAAGALSLDELLRVSEARGRFMIEAAQGGDLGTMAAVMAPREQVEKLIDGIDGLCIANHNAPLQSILSGSRDAIAAALERFAQKEITASPITVGAAFHSPIVAPASEKLADFIDTLLLSPPRFPVYANSTAETYPGDAASMRDILAGQLARPVEFVAGIERMYSDGARVFLSVGPKSVHVNLVRQILGDRPHRALASDDEAGGLKALLGALGGLLAEGATLEIARLWAGRDCHHLDLSSPEALRAQPPAKHIWMLNGSGAHPVGQPANKAMTVEDFAARDAKQHANGSTPKTVAPEQPAPTSAAHQRRHTTIAKRGKVMDQTYPYNEENEPAMPVPEPYAVSDRQAVLSDFQATMARFLDMQENVMLAYMGGAAARPVRRTQQATPVRRAAPLPVPVPVPTAAAVPAPAPAAPPPPPAPAPAAKAAAQPAAEPAPAAPDTLDKDKLTDIVLGLVEDRTGYPRDMLDMDLNIEADLGIDSIKRVEIVGALLKSLPASIQPAVNDLGETLNEQKTLGTMVAKLWERISSAPEVAEPRPFDHAAAQKPAPATEIEAPYAAAPRYLMRAVAEDLPTAAAASDLPGGRYLITADGAGLADALAGRIRAAGAVAQILRPKELLDDDALSALSGPDLAGVIHLSPATAAAIDPKDGLAAWRAQIELNEKLGYRLARALADRLRTGRILFASGLGGDFGRSAGTHGLKAAGGGGGLAKSIREEWPDCAAKAVDLDMRRSAGENAAHLFAELACAEGRVEIGYPGGQRTIFQTVAAPLGDDALIAPDAGWIVLATGGARGITAEVLRPLAACAMTLILWGRTPMPGAEPEDLAALPGEAALRTHFVQAAKAAGEAATPAAIGRRISAVLRDREMRANIRTFEALGATVVYQSVDVSDPGAVQAGLDAIYDHYGRLDGVVHGAGVIEDRLLIDKTPESWSRVVETKLVSAFALARGLKPESLKFLAFFASVAGRYGNSGQSDYAAANEVLNRLALHLRATWGDAVKVMAINWGPWQGTEFGAGMVSSEIRRKFEDKGVSLVAPKAGADAFFAEIARGPRADAEIILGEGPWERHEADMGAFSPAKMPEAAPAPLLADARPEFGERGGSSLKRTLSLPSDPYLDEHRLDGVAVLPLAVAMELAAEAVAEIWPDWALAEITGHKMLSGVRLEDDAPREIELLVTGGEHGHSDGFSAKVEIRSTGKLRRVHYRCAARLVDALPGAGTMPPFALPTRSSISAHDIYRDILFHGPRYQAVTKLIGLDDTGISTEIRPSDPGSFGSGAGWCFDPGLVDTAAQLVWVWSRQQRGMAALPNAIGRARRYDAGGAIPARMELRIRPETSGSRILADAYVLDGDGRMIMSLEGIESTANQALNRFCGWSGKIVA